MFGLILIVFGILFLLKKLGVVSIDVWGIFWPILLILIGVEILINSFKKKKFLRKFFSCGSEFFKESEDEKKTD